MSGVQLSVVTEKLNVVTANSGNIAPSTYCSSVFAAIADAPYSGPYVSIRYSVHAMKIRLPAPNSASVMTGTI